MINHLGVTHYPCDRALFRMRKMEGVNKPKRIGRENELLNKHFLNFN